MWSSFMSALVSCPPVPAAPPGLTVAAAAAVFGATPHAIATPGRHAAVARARQFAVYLHHVALGQSISSCARLFRRDRATVRHACARIEDMRDNPHFDFGVTILERALVAHRNLAQALAAGSVQEETMR
jgi:hypothetical protein